jgi:peptidoglycan hydrolase CwlO-like protein
MSDSKNKAKTIEQLKAHVSNLSGSILSIVELWENETAEMKQLPPELTAFNERMKFYREVFNQAQKVAGVPPKG